jgi:hypothetical protein
MGLWTPSPSLPPPLMLTTFSRAAAGAAFAGQAAAAPASGAIGVAATVVFPVFVEERITLVKAFVMNGATISGNFDIGIYDDGFNLIVSTGSTAQAGANTVQEVDIADFTLDAGAYHLGFALDSATATYFLLSTPFALTGGANFQTASPFPLPATFVSGGSTSGTLLFGFSQRTLVA